ncbi:MAG TPA: glycosyltransferase family 4 protein [Candidatus Eisenbacteria bacterium]|nr:glycosyltransferase family 4 protein [Candidatus Eisenbacteria bacterium]
MSSVLYVTTTFPTLAAFLENEVHRLKARGVRVRVLTLRGRSTSYQPEHADLVPLTEPVGDPFDARAWLSLAGWLVRKPHVLVPAVARLLWASRASGYALAGHMGYLPAAARVATIAEREDFERIHGAWAHFPASVAWLASRLTGRRFSMAGHAGSDLYRTQAFLAEKVRAADFVTACVRGNADMLRALAGPHARVEWIYHGVDRRRFDGTGRRPAAEPLLLCVGRLAATKGFDVAVRALGLLAARGMRPRLALVGDGPDRASLEQLAVACGVAAQVEFRGALEQRAVLALYREAWVLVSPSRVLANGRRDGIPNVIVEALAMGLPCVGTRVAGIEEVVKDGVNGCIVPPDDPTALADALATLLGDPARLERMGAAARGSVDESLDADRTFERVLALMAPGAGAVRRQA